MINGMTKDERAEEVRRILEEYGFENVALLESWDGDDLSELAEHLTAEEYQSLLDALEPEEVEGL